MNDDIPPIKEVTKCLKDEKWEEPLIVDILLTDVTLGGTTSALSETDAYNGIAS